jgi:hypothetical protein
MAAVLSPAIGDYHNNALRTWTLRRRHRRRNSSPVCGPTSLLLPITPHSSIRLVAGGARFRRQAQRLSGVSEALSMACCFLGGLYLNNDGQAPYRKARHASFLAPSFSRSLPSAISLHVGLRPVAFARFRAGWLVAT